MADYSINKVQILQLLDIAEKHEFKPSYWDSNLLEFNSDVWSSIFLKNENNDYFYLTNSICLMGIFIYIDENTPRNALHLHCVTNKRIEAKRWEGNIWKYEVYIEDQLQEQGDLNAISV